MKTKNKKQKKPLKSIYVLYDNAGEWAGAYDTWDEADNDAVGPRFRPEHTIREYRLVLRKNETLRRYEGTGTAHLRLAIQKLEEKSR